MIKHQSDPKLGHPFRDKRKRSALAIVVVISLLVHAIGLGTFAVIVIVDTFVKEPPVFEAVTDVMSEPSPPPPPPPSQKNTQRSMPRPQPMAARNPLDMAVPEIQIKSGDLATGLTGRGLGGGLGELGGGLMDSVRITGFGFDRMLEDTMEGHLYDFKLTRNGDPNHKSVRSTQAAIRDFTRTHWSTSRFNRDYYRADKTLYASYFVIPSRDAGVAPQSFEATDKIKPTQIVAVYRGTFKPQESGTFRFYGRGDDVMVIRINNKIVIDASWSRDTYSDWKPNAGWDASFGEALFDFGPDAVGVYGNWFELRAGQPTEIEIILGEIPGGLFGSWLTIEKKGGEGPRIFSTRPLSAQDKAYLKNVHPDIHQFL